MTDEQPASERQRDRRERSDPPSWRPVPDPTALTTEALHREVANLREIIEEKIVGVTAQMAIQVSELRGVIDEQRRYYDTILSERDSRYGERFHDSQESIKVALASADKAVAAAFDAREKALSEATLARDKALEAATVAAEKAILKSESAQEKRADSIYVTLDRLQTALNNVMPRSEAENRYATIADIIGELRRTTTQEMTSLRDRVKEVEATKIGATQVNDKIDVVMKAFEARVIALQQQLAGIEAVTR